MAMLDNQMVVSMQLWKLWKLSRSWQCGNAWVAHALGISPGPARTGRFKPVANSSNTENIQLFHAMFSKRCTIATQSYGNKNLKGPTVATWCNKLQQAMSWTDSSWTHFWSRNSWFRKSTTLETSMRRAGLKKPQNSDSGPRKHQQHQRCILKGSCWWVDGHRQLDFLQCQAKSWILINQILDHNGS